MLKININEKVRVRLTEYGKQCLAENYAKLSMASGAPLSMPNPKLDADGWTEWQLWRLMQEFGQHIAMGLPVPFEANEMLIPQPNTGDKPPAESRSA